MKLGDWLRRNQVSRADFARRIGVSPGAVTLICREHGSWLSRETAERIVAETQGAVTPNDFLNAPRAPIGLDMLNPVADAIEAFARGEIVAVTDDDDRENEGDLIVAASLCTTEKMAFIIRNCCGIVCVPLTSEDARRLNLAPMVAINDAPLGTAFTVSVDVRHGLTTGISADKHRIKRISVADLIAYRQAREKLVERVACFPVKTPIGELQGYAYRTRFDPVLHFAFVHGTIGDGREVPARLHRADILGDIFGGGAIPKVLSRFKAEGRGALIYLRDGSAGVPANLGGTHATGSDDARDSQWREIGLGAQILRDLGVTSIRLRTDNPRTYVGLAGFGIEITAVEPIDG